MKFHLPLLVLCMLLLFAGCGDASLGSVDDADWILLKSGSINTSAERSDIQTMSVGSGYHIVQFRGPVQQKWKDVLIQNGVCFDDYIPNNAHIIYLDRATLSKIEHLDFIKWIGPVRPEYKIQPELADVDSNSAIILNVIGYEPALLPDTANKIADMDADIISLSEKSIQLQTRPGTIRSIAAIDNVKWIEKNKKRFLLNNNASRIMNVTYMQQHHSLTGKGQIIGLIDTGLDSGINNESMHPDIRGRIKNLSSWGDDDASDTDGHGTHVAGSLMGNGSMSEGKYKGTAPEAQLVFQAVAKSDGSFHNFSLFELLSFAYDRDARIHSNSWAYYGSNGYNIDSWISDKFMWNNTDILIVFAVGNDGPDNYTVCAPSTAKNVLSIGATENFRPEVNYTDADNPSEIANSSGRGPTIDERIKPDVVAPGTWIISTRSRHVTNDSKFWAPLNDSYAYMGGTSMATPLASGTVALARQYYMENLSITPSAALLKATLINGADDLGLNRNAQGFGRINLTNSLNPPSATTIQYHDNVNISTTGSTWTAHYSIDDSQTPLKTTLVWTDYPPSPSSSKALVNNLDLKVISPDGSVYYGNGAVDNVNNVEQVALDSPETGLYTFHVNGTNVPYEQSFALVISGANLTFKDIVPPVINDIVYQPEVNTGEILHIAFNASDNIGINHSLTNFNTSTNSSARLKQNGTWYNYTLDVPVDSVEDIVFNATFHDDANNSKSSDDIAVNVSDNIAPVIHSCLTPTFAMPNEDIVLKFHADDNIGIETARLNISSEPKPLNLTGNDGWYRYSFTAPAGTDEIHYNATFMDAAGNSISCGQYVLEMAAAEKSSPVLIGAGQPSGNVESTDTGIKKVLAGSNVKYDFSDSEGPVMAIGFNAKDNEGTVVAKVQVLKDKPDDVDTPSGNSYQLMSITVGSQDTISDDNADNILIEFKVSREWTEQNKIDPATIRMTKFHDGEWQDLPGNQADEDDEYLYFTAQTPGFSVFSIVGDEYKEVIEEPVAEESGVEEVEEPASENQNAHTPGFTAMFAIALIAGAALVMWKRI